MFDKSHFEIIGRIGKIKNFDNVTRISIAANASYKEKGEWVDRTYWNEVVIFEKNTRDYVQKNASEGRYIRVEGIVRQSSYERDGEKIYTTELISDSLSLLPLKKPTNDGE